MFFIWGGGANEKINGSVEFLKICSFFVSIVHILALLYCSSLYFVDINLSNPGIRALGIYYLIIPKFFQSNL